MRKFVRPIVLKSTFIAVAVLGMASQGIAEKCFTSFDDCGQSGPCPSPNPTGWENLGSCTTTFCDDEFSCNWSEQCNTTTTPKRLIVRQRTKWKKDVSGGTIYCVTNPSNTDGGCCNCSGVLCEVGS